MKRLLFLIVAGLAAVAATGRAAPDNPARNARPATLGHQDIVYFAESRPVLIRLHVTVDGKPLDTAWDDCITNVFRYLDANGDGFLDRNELQRVPAPEALFGGNYNGSAVTMNDLDTNGDGKVSRDELAAYYRRHGATPFQVAAGASRNDEMVIRLQVELALAELAEQEVILVQGGGRRNTNDVNEALFKLLDTNGDGKLSKAELLAAPTVLLKRDRNDDEMVTPDEILPGAGGGRGDQLAFVLLQRSRAMRADRGANGPFWMDHAGTSKTDLARRLVQQYRPKNAQDKPANTKLARKDLGLDEAAFAKLDVDGDGLLDSEELSRFAQRTPDLELKVDLGPKATVELVKRGAALEGNVRKSSDGTLMLELAGTRLDLKGLAVAKVDAARLAKEEREQYLAEFKRADRDNNGYLDMAEAMRSPLYRNLFKLMDRDGDGMLFDKEVIAYLDAYQGLQAAARMSCATVGVTSEGKGLFELLDTNGDGRLSVREMRNAVKLLAEFDRSNTGFLSRTDIPRCSVATFRTGPASSNGARPLRAFNLYTGRMARDGQPAPAPRGPEWFRKMDRNGDGDVSRREFLGTDEQFKEIDTNGDGLISVEEAEAYDRKMQGKN